MLHAQSAKCARLRPANAIEKRTIAVPVNRAQNSPGAMLPYKRSAQGVIYMSKRDAAMTIDFIKCNGLTGHQCVLFVNFQKLWPMTKMFSSICWLPLEIACSDFLTRGQAKM